MLTKVALSLCPRYNKCAEYVGVKTSIIAAHFLSYSKKDIAQPLLAISNINLWRNGLLWCPSIEEAWEDSRICLTYSPVPTPGFLLHILDERMLDMPITADFPGMVYPALKLC